MIASYVVESLADGRLRVFEQTEYLFALGFGIPAAIGMTFFIYRAFRSRSGYPLIGALLCCAFLLAGLRGMNTGSLVLDRAGNLASFHEPTMLWHNDFTVPLNQVHYAEVRGGAHSDYVVVVMKNGDGLRFSDSNQQDGKGRAAHAINEYVGYSGR